MSLTEAELRQIVDTIDARLADLATGQHLAVQLIQDTLARLEHCRQRLDAVSADLARSIYHETDAVTTLQIYRDLVETQRTQLERGREAAEEQRERIKALERRIHALERQQA